MAVQSDALFDHYRAFAHAAEGRSPLYVELANAIAVDRDMLSRLVGLPQRKQQPNLLFGAVKYLFGVVETWQDFSQTVREQWTSVKRVILSRRTQTNEPARCATILPVLAQLKPPLALLEVGAAAGLCLYPDRYGYDYGRVQLQASSTEWPTLACKAGAYVPLPSHPVEVIWRAGLDLNPLNPCNADDVRWLKALVWPGEGSRECLLEQALAAACSEPPRIVRGDLRDDLAALASEAPAHATLVIYHSAVLNYLPDPVERKAFTEVVRLTGAEWIAQEAPDIFAADNRRGWPAGSVFLLTRNGYALANAESHGSWIDWLA